MWQLITNKNEIESFLQKINYFHDSCIKEIKYLSGAYVNHNLGMHPINSINSLRILFQSQNEMVPMFELNFSKLKKLVFFPFDEQYTCEIFDAMILKKDDLFYWCDNGLLTEKDIETYNGNLVCSSELQWRPVNNCMGSEEFYKSKS